MKQIDFGNVEEDLIFFTEKYQTLIVTSQKVLLDTVKHLQCFVSLSSKVLPLKSYYKIVQLMQKNSVIGKWFSEYGYENQPKKTEDSEKVRDIDNSKIEALEKELDYLMSIVSQKGEDAQKKGIHYQINKKVCNEDVFMLAAAFLEVEIGKQGCVVYLRGEAPDLKEFKKHRVPMDLDKEVVLKSLASALARPDEDRGKVEREQILVGINHLVKQMRMRRIMYALVQWIRECEANNLQHRRNDILRHFKLTHTAYLHIMAMARREGVITNGNRQRDPLNKYHLTVENHSLLLEFATKIGKTPQKTVNQIVENWFDMLFKLKSGKQNVSKTQLFEKQVRKLLQPEKQPETR